MTKEPRGNKSDHYECADGTRRKAPQSECANYCLAAPKAVDIDALPWEPVRIDVAQGVFGKTLSDLGTKIVYTRVAPGGGFSAHRDGYWHMLFVLGGEGRAEVGEQAFDLRPGLIVEVAAGEEHCYRNTGDGDLILIAANIPAVPGGDRG